MFGQELPDAAAGLSEYEASEAERIFYHHDRETVRELAELYDPSKPVSQNSAYIARARELQKELETAFLTRSTEEKSKAEN